MTTEAKPTRTPRSGSKPRRRHAATGARILAGGLSAATALGLMGAMAGGAGSTGGSGSPAPVQTITTPPLALLATQSSSAPIEGDLGATSQTTSSAETTQVPPAPQVVPADAPPVTVSQGS